MRVRLDGSNASDQLVINGGQATGKTWLAFTNVGNSNLGVATTGQGIRLWMHRMAPPQKKVRLP